MVHCVTHNMRLLVSILYVDPTMTMTISSVQRILGCLGRESDTKGRRGMKLQQIAMPPYVDLMQCLAHQAEKWRATKHIRGTARGHTACNSAPNRLP
jgi:hypothetical protein